MEDQQRFRRYRNLLPAGECGASRTSRRTSAGADQGAGASTSQPPDQRSKPGASPDKRKIPLLMTAARFHDAVGQNGYPRSTHFNAVERKAKYCLSLKSA
jgi:hypothetical protein